MKRTLTQRLLVFLFVLFFIYFGGHRLYETASLEENQVYFSGEAVTFSLESGYYTGVRTVALSKDWELPLTAEIYYTLNGDDPNSLYTKYESEIVLMPAESGIAVYPLKAVVYYKGQYSDIFEQTYVIVDEEIATYGLDVVSITSDSKNLYDYDTGIMVPGRTYDENVAAGEEGHILGNYNNRDEAWIRDAHVALFDQEGNLELEQDIGLGISGGTSASMKVKSLKLYADVSYDPSADKLLLAFDDALGTEGKAWSHVYEYNSIRLRSGSQDQDYGNIRSAVVSRLAAMSGFNGCADTRRCIVFLNGTFYGIFDMQQNYSNSYLANRFNLEDRESVEKMKGGESSVLLEAGIEEAFLADLTKEENRNKLESVVDMDNYLMYYALSILYNNTDWPANNFEMWRYTGPIDENNPYTDGRWRFLIYDTDTTWYKTDSFYEMFEGSKGDAFFACMESMYRGGNTFSNVMQSSYYRNRFVTIVCDLFNTSFSPENVEKIITEENVRIRNAKKEYYAAYVWLSDLCAEEIIEQALRRPDEMEAYFSTYFDLEEKYDFTLNTSKGVAVLWNNMEIWGDSSYSNEYYRDVEMTIRADAYPGYTFSYWLVNGNPVYDTELTISSDLIQNGKMQIEAVAEQQEEALVINAVSAKGDEDWIRISNVGNSSINCSNYYITDRADDLMQFQLPDVELAPGESITINGSKNYDEIGSYICNFSLGEYENLILSNGYMVLDMLVIPKMEKIEYYGRYDNSNIWKYFLKQ